MTNDDVAQKFFLTKHDAQELLKGYLLEQHDIIDLWREKVETKIKSSAEQGRNVAYINLGPKYISYSGKLMIFGERVLGFSIQLDELNDAFRVYW